MLTDSERQLIEQVRAAEAKADPRKWEWIGPQDGYSRLRIPGAPPEVGGTSELYTYHKEVVLAVIARNSIPALLAIIERLEQDDEDRELDHVEALSELSQLRHETRKFPEKLADQRRYLGDMHDETREELDRVRDVAWKEIERLESELAELRAQLYRATASQRNGTPDDE